MGLGQGAPRDHLMTMQFDSVIGPVSDRAGLTWRQPSLR
jgi:hypothetical protein